MYQWEITYDDATSEAIYGDSLTTIASGFCLWVEKNPLSEKSSKIFQRFIPAEGIVSVHRITSV